MCCRLCWLAAIHRPELLKSVLSRDKVPAAARQGVPAAGGAGRRQSRSDPERKPCCAPPPCVAPYGGGCAQSARTCTRAAVVAASVSQRYLRDTHTAAAKILHHLEISRYTAARNIDADSKPRRDEQTTRTTAALANYTIAAAEYACEAGCSHRIGCSVRLSAAVLFWLCSRICIS